MSGIKAYSVTNVEADYYATVVFAKNRGEAKKLAMMTDACEDAEFIKIRAIRTPQLDQYYHGNYEMHWDDAGDRIALVRLAGFRCSYEIDKPECEDCPAKQWCERAQNTEDYLPESL